jgi:hypothetical protein
VTILTALKHFPLLITPIKVFENELFYNLDVQMVKPCVHYNGTTHEYLFVMLELDK